MLHKMLQRVAREFVYERAKDYAGNEFANFVRHDLAIEAKKQLILQPFELKVKASVGAGNWASVPWLGFFDPLITDSATRGFYVVYLINPQSEEIVLSMNQGTTEVYSEFGPSTGRDVLRRRAIDMTDRVSDFAKKFSSDPIDLGSEEALPMGYVAGHAFGRTYTSKTIDEDQFYDDLYSMFTAYSALVERGGIVPLNTMFEEAGNQNIDETRKYVLSRRIERAPKVRNMVLERRGLICEACNLDPELHFGYSGPAKNVPLDVHHAQPISGMAEGETRRYNIPADFLVLCPNCHRMIHKQEDKANLERLRSQIKFEYSLKPK